VKPTGIFALILIAAGIAAIAYQGFTFTTQEKVVDLGPVHVEADRTRSVPLPPLVGGIAIMAGVVLLAVGRRSR
jgi:hypothetical protein